MSAPLPHDEFKRLEALARYAVLDTLPEPCFDRLTQLAARLFKVPVALINLVDQDRLWAKACFGTTSRELERPTSFCAHTILSEEPLVIPDATQDTRFRSSPLVNGPAHARFYGGAPLVTPDGFRIGTLCILDQKPRASLSAEERATLGDLAALAMDELELRLAKQSLETESQAKTQMLTDLRRATDTAQTLAAVTELATYDLDPDDLVKTMGQLLAQATNVQWMGVHAENQPLAVDDPAWHGPGASPAFLEQMKLDHHHPERRRPAVTGGKPLFLSVQDEEGAGSTALLSAGVRSAAWLPFTTAEGTRRVASFARFGEASTWHPWDRQLLSTSAHILSLTLSRREHQARLEAARERDHLLQFGSRQELERVLVRHSGRGTSSFLVLLCLEGLARDIALEEGWWTRVWNVVLPDGAGGHRRLYRYAEHKFAMLMEGSVRDADLVLSSLDAAATLLQTGPSTALKVRLGATPIPEDLQDPATFLNTAEAGLRVWKRETTDEEQVEADGTPAASGVHSQGGLTLDQHQREVTFGSQTVKLSRQETALLCALMTHPHRVFSREALAREAWGETSGATANLVNVQVFNLRQKLAVLGLGPVVQTVRGLGYSFQVAQDEASPASLGELQVEVKG